MATKKDEPVVPQKPADPAPHTAYVAPVKEYVNSDQMTTAPERMLNPETGQPMTQAEINERNAEESAASRPLATMPADKSGEPQPAGSPTNPQVREQANTGQAVAEPNPSRHLSAEQEAGRRALANKQEGASKEVARGKEVADKNKHQTEKDKKDNKHK